MIFIQTDIRNPFRLKKELNYAAIKKSFQTKTETKVIKDRIRRDIKNLFEN